MNNRPAVLRDFETRSFDAELEVHVKPKIGMCIAGVITNDKKCRFRDNQYIHTSPIATIIKDKTGKYIETIGGSVYKITRQK